MPRIALAVMATAAVLAGCSAGSSFHGSAEISNWTPKLSSTINDGSGAYDVVGTGQVIDDDAFWAFDIGLQYGRASGSQISAATLNLGYFGHEYEGPGGVTAKYDLYKFTYGEPSTSSQGGRDRTEGLLGIHYLNTSVTGASVDDFTRSAPMFVVGWQIAYNDRNIVYFLRVEGMDLNLIPIDNVKGSVLDYSAGLRWQLGGTSALSVGYRSYEAKLNRRDESINLDMDGMFASFFFTW